MTSFDWVAIRYRNVIAVLKNPFYAAVLRVREKRETHLHRKARFKVARFAKYHASDKTALVGCVLRTSAPTF